MYKPPKSAANPEALVPSSDEVTNFPVAPNDTLQDLRTRMVLMMEDCGIDVEAQTAKLKGEVLAVAAE